MNSRMNNERGFALVFGLVILLLATVGGTALLFMTQKDRTEASDYTKMRSASQVATAALKACEGAFQNDASVALAILKKYKSNNAYQWMFGTDANANSEHRITLGTAAGAPQYSARIIGYDDVNQYIIIEGIGYINNGGKKRVIATYKLAGLAMVTANMPILTYGLFLGGALQNCSSPISFNGDVYLSMDGCGTCQHFNVGGTINGNLKTSATDNYLDICGSGLTVTGKAFMRCKMMPQKPFTVNGKAGFTNGFMNYTAPMQLKDDAFFIQTSTFGSANCVVGQGSHTVKYNSSIGADRFSGFGTKTPVTLTAANVATELGMSPNNEATYTLNIPSWGTDVAQNVSGTVTGENVDSWWTAKQTAGKLYQNKWLVLTLNNTVTMNGGTFHKKVIWVTGSNSINCSKNWYNCDDASNTLLIVNSSGFLNDMGVADNCKFRGFIYVNTSSANTSYKFGSHTTIYGAIHHANNSQFNLNDGPSDSVRINFTNPLGQSALQEIANSGIIVAPGAGGGSAAPILTLIDLKIRPTLLSMQL